jgi:predicted NAD/FAD-dependent oxidoreductase
MPWFAYLFHNCSLRRCFASLALFADVFAVTKSVSLTGRLANRNRTGTRLPYGAEYNG